MKIGILALQGDFSAHEKMIRSCGVETVQIKKASQLPSIEGLILPGGESTTQLKLLEKYDFPEALESFHQAGKGLFATCAGVILLSEKILGLEQRSFQLLHVSVLRNAYGSQKESFETPLHIPKLGETTIPGIFIRAPQIAEVGKEVEVLCTYQGQAVLVQEKNILGATFHPELGQDRRIHEYFLSLCQKS